MNPPLTRTQSRTRNVAATGVLLIFGLALTGCPPGETPTVRERSRLALIRERPGDARVDGIGEIAGFARGRDCTFIHCLELVLAAVGRQITYDELMAVSGMAFRTQFCVERWDVGNPDPLAGDSRLDDLFASIGWRYEVRIVRREELAEADALHRAIKQSIDNSVPVLAANVIPPEDWGIITGYRQDRIFLCRSYNGGALQSDQPVTGWPTAVVMLTQRQSPRVREKSRLDAIKLAVELFEQRSAGPYAQGARAFDEWCQSLRGVTDGSYSHANFWTYICLIDARAAAVRYLRSVERDFGSKQFHVTAAADLYDEEVRLLLDTLASVPNGDAYRDQLPPQTLRDTQIDALMAAKNLEARAIESLKKAL